MPSPNQRFQQRASASRPNFVKGVTMSGINMLRFNQIKVAIISGYALLFYAVWTPAAPLTPGDPILLPNTHDGFDFIRLDAAANRLLMGHEGNKSFDVFDLNTRKLLKAVPTSTAQDAAADVKRGLYYVSGNDPARMVILDSAKLEVVGEVHVPANTDL